MTQAALVGLAVGLVNGALCHGALFRVRDRSDQVFYWVWGAGMLYRLAFFGAACWWLATRMPERMVPGLLSLVAGQLAVGVIPIKRLERRRENNGSVAHP